MCLVRRSSAAAGPGAPDQKAALRPSHTAGAVECTSVPGGACARPGQREGDRRSPFRHSPAASAHRLKRADRCPRVFSSRPSLPLPAPHTHSSPSSSRSSSFLNSLPRSGACESWALAAMVVARFLVLHVRVRRRASVLCSSPRLAAFPPHAGEDREVAGTGSAAEEVARRAAGCEPRRAPCSLFLFSGRARRRDERRFGAAQARPGAVLLFFLLAARGVLRVHARTRARRALPRNHAHGALRPSLRPHPAHLV
jgi:hypothetical protein